MTIHERMNENTPCGGDYSEIFYFDNNGKPVDAKDATNGSTFEPPLFHDFNPRPPWGGRQDSSSGSELNIFISIHALRGEGDAKAEAHSVEVPVFQSTPSVGRATVFYRTHRRKLVISIHALRGEGDYLMTAF